MKSTLKASLALLALVSLGTSARAEITNDSFKQTDILAKQGTVIEYSAGNGAVADTIPAIKVPGGFIPLVRPGQTYQPPGPHQCGQTITVTPPVPGKQYTLHCPPAQN